VFVPYVLLAPLAGYLNDRFPKTNWLLGGNLIKLTGTLLAMLSISGDPLWQGIGYFIVGIGACVYSPAKYGILPEILAKERLVKANGTIEMLTLVAILIGTVGGAVLVDKLPLSSAIPSFYVFTAHRCC
jgi:LPLT family lysophospholipid transporter-like MFS transporter